MIFRLTPSKGLRQDCSEIVTTPFKPYHALHKTEDEVIWFCSHSLILLIEIHIKTRRYSSLYLFEKKRTLLGGGGEGEMGEGIMREVF